MFVIGFGYLALIGVEMLCQYIVYVAGDGHFVFTYHLDNFQDAVVVILADIDLLPLTGGEAGCLQEKCLVSRFVIRIPICMKKTLQ